ncbi:DENN domain-containing protein 1B isoform X5 [Acanthochromis polyacanthus]|uniref:DENN domain-containing protein 1B isoform X5 n=1 Tax=Acanthochromis polyacanthus TaxID=80966 RepID=UPI002234B098|nr:DENN domain-containing protein 1B isoform X5 [Acanthochromis polyacanthus]
MGSRLKQNPERTFYWFFEATCPVARDKDPGLLFQFPEDFSDEESCQTLPRFCFPYDIQRVRDGVAVQHFTFVLTDLEGCQRFGFCRLTNSTHTCLCILSYLPWFEVFYKLLNSLADYLSKGQTNEMKALLAALYKQPLPLAAGSVTLQMGEQLLVSTEVSHPVGHPEGQEGIPYFIAPDPRSLPSIPENRNLTELIVAVDVGNLLQLYASLLFERRILIFASKLSTMSELKVCLKRQAVSPGCGVSLAFLKAQALLFGGYRDALQGQKEGEICFCETLFLDHKSPSMKQFLQSAIHLQFFKQFIDSRLDILNKGKEPDDLFEEEIIKCETTAGRGKSYQQLVGNLKKGGGALILNMKSKANMRAKGLAKSGLKNLLMQKLHNEEHKLQRGGSITHRRVQSDCLQSRLPITQHFGKSRPRRPVHKQTPRDKDNMRDTGDTWDGAVSGPVAEDDSELLKDEEEGEDSLLCDPEEMDLLGEIFDTLSSRSSHERGLLYGTRSLDLFGPDSHDFIMKYGPVNPSQESLSLSMSGSESLHSWNLETTEELSDLTEDSDWLCLDTSVPEEEGTESLLTACEKEEQEKGQRQDGEEREDVKVAINGNQEDIDDKNNFKEIKLEEEREKDQERKVSLGEDPASEMAEKQENEGLEEAVGLETEKGTNEMQKIVTREEETQEEESKEVGDSLNKLMKLNTHHPSSAEEQQGHEETANPETTVPPGPQSLAADLKPPTGQDKKSEEATRKEEQEVRQIRSPPKVQSAVERFQSQASGQSFQVKTRTKALAEPGRPVDVFRSRERSQTHPPCDSDVSHTNSRSEAPEEEERPAIKVSELKKRFEA